MRAWCSREFLAHGIHFLPVQANMGLSHKAGTIRGLHFQRSPHQEAKLVRCTRGAVFDVLVDLRPGSVTFGHWFGTELSADNGRLLYVPPLCAHGYQTLQAETEVLYLASAYYAPECVGGLRFDDVQVGIRWPLSPEAVSDQDRAWPDLASLGKEHS
jgi:dTDP-4-dehydrorhamnose 3,5-epimerase